MEERFYDWEIKNCSTNKDTYKKTDLTPLKLFSFTLIRLLLFISLHFVTSCNSYAIEVYNVKDFGAKGDNVNDDIISFERCFNEALKNKHSKVVIPYGTYRLSRTLKLDFLNKNLEITGLYDGKHRLPVIIVNENETVIHIKGYLFDISEGIINVSNLNLRSSNVAYSKSHKFINKDVWNAGLLITDKRVVYIHNVHIKDIYGQGIHISDTKPTGIPRSARFFYVEITNCTILDVWGYNPKKDNYGDGIYLSNVTRAKIKGNKIHNHTDKTKQLGRCGIVLEYMAENVVIESNEVRGGYDRALHIENTYGGHRILSNRFLGSDLSLVLFEPGITNSFRYIEFIGNVFSNENTPKNHNLTKVYGNGAFGDRALLVLLTRGVAQNKKIIFKNNLLSVNGSFEYESNSILNNRSGSALFYNNSYRYLNNDTNNTLTIFNYENASMNDEKIGKWIAIEKTKI